MQPKLIAGAVVIVIGLVIAFIFAGGGDDPAPGSGSGTSGTDSGEGIATGCTITAGGAGLVAASLTRGRTTDEVLGAVGSAMTGFGCNKVVTDLMNGQPAPVVVEAGTQATTTTVTYDQLVSQPPTTAPSGGAANDLDCLNYDTWWAFNLCWDGIIPPLTQ